VVLEVFNYDMHINGAMEISVKEGSDVRDINHCLTKNI
jgi:hypothetical protein